MSLSAVIAGAGPTGLTATLALAGAGVNVTLVGPRPSRDDQRTAALMGPSAEFLHSLVPGLLDNISTPFTTMRILDASGGLFPSAPMTFHAAEIDQPAFAYNVENAELCFALAESVQQDTRIRWVDDLADALTFDANGVVLTTTAGDAFRANLAVGADGRNSAIRAAAGISAQKTPLNQVALVTNIQHSRPHEFATHEFHYPGGPLTQVPMQGNQSSLVWVVTPELAQEIGSMESDEVAHMIETRMHSLLGALCLTAKMQMFPISRMHASRFSTEHVALVGEAAHAVEPIGAQGLNMSLKDIAVLTETLADCEPSSLADRLETYNRSRRSEVLVRTSTIAALNNSLIYNHLPQQLMRKLAASALNRFSPLRSFFMRRAMGLAG